MRQTSRRGVGVSITEEKAQPPVVLHAATTVEGPTSPVRSARRRRWRKVATWAIACSAVVLAAGGYVAVHMSSEPAPARARSRGLGPPPRPSRRLRRRPGGHGASSERGLGPPPRPSRRLRRRPGGHGASSERGLGPPPRPSRRLRRRPGGHGASSERGLGPPPRPSRRLAGTGTRRGVLRTAPAARPSRSAR